MTYPLVESFLLTPDYSQLHLFENIISDLLLVQIWWIDCPFITRGEMTLSNAIASSSEIQMPERDSERTASYSFWAKNGS